MAGDQDPSLPPERRVLPFRSRTRTSAPPPVAGLDKYQRTEDGDDYRHRMLVNVAALVVVLLLMAAGYWLADSMARMRKGQDCVLSGRAGCTPVEYERGRW